MKDIRKELGTCETEAFMQMGEGHQGLGLSMHRGAACANVQGHKELHHPRS